MKKLVKAFKQLAAIAISSILFCSCATIVAGGDPSITINGDVPEPVTITTEKQTYPGVILPAVVKVNRHHLEGQRIQVKSDNYKYNDIVLDKTVNGWAFGNILLGGIIGLSVDLITNCVSKPSQTYFNIMPLSKVQKEAMKEGEE